jgi:glycosyltransferase involved in cell wall biosynthesis
MFASDLVRSLREIGLPQRVAILRASGDVSVPFDAPTAVLTGARDGQGNGGGSVRAIRALRQLVAGTRPALVLAHGGDPLKYATAAGRGAPVVYRRIGSTPRWMAGQVRRAAYGRLFRRARCVVAVADAVRREMVEQFGVPPGRVVTIPNAVDERRMTATRDPAATRHSLGIPSDAPVVLSVGAFTLEKDPETLLRVAGLVLDRCRDAYYVMVGNGPLRAETERTAATLRMSGRIVLPGARSDVPDLLAAADVLLLASRTEGMPGIVIEAGMAGLPVASWSIAGVPEVVVDGVTGRLAAPGATTALAGMVEELLGDQRRRMAMGQAARDRCRSQFEIGIVVPRYLQLYEHLTT